MRDGRYEPMRSAPRQFEWLRLHLMVRALFAVEFSPAVKRELQRCAELRRMLIKQGTFN